MEISNTNKKKKKREMIFIKYILPVIIASFVGAIPLAIIAELDIFIETKETVFYIKASIILIIIMLYIVPLYHGVQAYIGVSAVAICLTVFIVPLSTNYLNESNILLSKGYLISFTALFSKLLFVRVIEILNGKG